MFSILNHLTLQKELQNIVTNYVFSTKSKHTTTTKHQIKYKYLSKPIIETGTSPTPVGCVTSGPPSQLKVSIVVNPFNCFNAMDRNVNKQANLRAVLLSKMSIHYKGISI